MSNAIIVSPLPIVESLGWSGTAAGAGSNVGVGVAADMMGLFWRSPGTTAQCRIDLGSDQLIDTIAMLAVYGAPSGAVSILYATDAQGGGFASVGLGVNQYQFFGAGSAYAGANPLTNGRQAFFWNGTAFTARYVMISVSGVTSGQFQFSRAILGLRRVMSRNFGYGATFGIRDLSSVDFSPRAVLLRRSAAKLRTIELSFPHVYKDEFETWFNTLNEFSGNDKSVFVITDPDPHPMRTRRIYYGPMTGDIGAVWRTAAGFECRVGIESVF